MVNKIISFQNVVTLRIVEADHPGMIECYRRNISYRELKEEDEDRKY
ncbi:hypothetical protein HNQ80_000855 [Anaerosolibacter carboniphilus]|uniref:Uncharacterized protein n=1 Tax=Anaerosolibacter carboniphilus TaxID=1417629 RepID=A0A841KRT0_9FIRM|nr:hypothetical protein [Anaerosolibacter carboniphilus]MBB6214770.1 hypothetical protein [Anaerosolibacter carboniphilus]